ncbi:MAG: ComEC/Rec2 family competence protein [bacterium]
MRDKKILFIIIALGIFNGYFLCLVIFQNSINGMRVIFFDVGQGDASLIMAEGGINILIDGGPCKKVIEKLDKYLSFWDRKIDIMVLTHPHADHIIGLIDALKKYQVEEVWMTGVLPDSSEYSEFLKITEDKNIDIKIVGDDVELMINNIINAPIASFQRGIAQISPNTKIEILYPMENLFDKKIDNLNNSSIVLKVSYKDNSFLFTGDIEEYAEEKLLCADYEYSPNEGDCRLSKLDADVLKVAHHGSGNSSSQFFLEAVKPKYAVISVGENNDFGMPSLRVLRRLERMGIKVFRTDLDKDVIMETDGKEIKKLIN